MERKLLLEKLMVSQPQVDSYLTFSSPNSFTLKVVDNEKRWDGTLKYSTDKTNWSTWNGTTTLSSASDGTKHNLYLRGTGNTYITGGISDHTGRWVLTGSNISCEGNIENLLDYATVSLGNHPTMATYSFANLFWGNTNLISAPALPATTLAESCYSCMFYQCSSLTTAPALPATTLTDYCYYYMFYECTSLTTAPALPATTLARYCYHNMFSGCTSLVNAPALPATTLAESCYSYMFSNCSSLTTPPALPATTLAEWCYSAMFGGCTSLTTVPALPATTLARYCYAGMFYNCSNIKLSETQTDEYQTPYRIPTTGTGITATDALTYMFTNTGGTFTGTPIINKTYYTSNTVV